jgi:serine/threonine-protein kinase RsbT
MSSAAKPGSGLGDGNSASLSSGRPIDLLRILEETLAQHLSPTNARVVVERSRRVLPDTVLRTPEDRARLLSSVRSTLHLFTSDVRALEIVEDLERRLSPGPSRSSHELKTFPIENEDDLRVARAGARDLCLAFGASSSEAQRVATAVSELARNIVSYTPGGKIELDLTRGPPLRIFLMAHDRGSGIANLDQILAGQYRSKNGLGRGLLGVKRLMKHFFVHTGPQGTRIEGEVTLS